MSASSSPSGLRALVWGTFFLGWVTTVPAAAQDEVARQIALARAAMDQDDPVAAERALQRALDFKPADPELHWRLGQARALSGNLDGALEAWRRTLELAPQHRRASELIASLEGADVQVTLRLMLIEDLMDADLDDRARQELGRLHRERAISDAVTERMLELDLLLLTRGDGIDREAVLASLQELKLRFPARIGDARREFLEARALVAAGQRSAGLQRLGALAESSPEFAADAQLELTLARIDGSGDQAEALESWCAANPGHTRVRAARSAALSEYARRASRATPLDPEEQLSALDAVVVDAALRLAATQVLPEDHQAVLQRVRKYLEQREKGGPSESRCMGLERLIVGPWSPDQSLALRLELVSLRFARARAVVEELAERGLLGSLEGSFEQQPALASAIAHWRSLRAEAPTLSTNKVALDFATALASAAQTQVWPLDRKQLLAAESWALLLASELASNADAEAATAAFVLAVGMIERSAARDLPAAIAFGEGLLTSTLAPPSAIAGLVQTLVSWHLKTIETKMRGEQAEVDRAVAALHTYLSYWVTRRPRFATELAAPLNQQLATNLVSARDEDATRWMEAWRYLTTAFPVEAARESEMVRTTSRIDRSMARHQALGGAGLDGAMPAAEQASVLLELDQLQASLPVAHALNERCEQQRSRWVHFLHGMKAHRDTVFELLLPNTQPERAPRVARHCAVLRFELRLAHARESIHLELQRDLRGAAIPEELAEALAAYAQLPPEVGIQDRRNVQHEAMLSVGAQLVAAGASDWALQVLAAVEKNAGANEELAARARFAAGGARYTEGLRLRTGASEEERALGEMLTAAIDDFAAVLVSYPRTQVATACVPQVRRIAMSLAQSGAWSAAHEALQHFLEVVPPLEAADELRFAIAFCDVGAVLDAEGLALFLQFPSDALDALTRVPKAEAAKSSDEFVALDLGGSAVGRNSYFVAEPELKLLEVQRMAAAALAERAARVKDDASFQKAQQSVSTTALPPAEVQRRIELFERFRSATQAGIDSVYRAEVRALARASFAAIAAHWTRFSRHDQAAAFLSTVAAKDATHPKRAELRLDAALALLPWAAAAAPRADDIASRRELEQRYQAARDALGILATEANYPQPLAERAVAEASRSYLTQARALDGALASRSRGAYVRAAKELARTAAAHPKHPAFASVGTELLQLGDELAARSLAEAAVDVWRVFVAQLPTDPLARQAASRIALTWAATLNRPLSAVEAYLELHHLSAGLDPLPAAQILSLATQLQSESRWVEALHALEVFVEGFPEHPEMATALERIGAVHAENGAWNEALAAYRRVMQEHAGTPVAHQARWATARAWIYLSKWGAAEEAYRVWQATNAEPAQRVEADRRRLVLKDLARHQALVDEEGQRKAFDAQFQIARIVHEQLGEVPKAIDEYAKVAERWPECHLADDALYQVGLLHFQRGAIQEGRTAMLALAERYPSSPTSDDALFAVGESYELQADQLGAITRTGSMARANEIAQRQAYQIVADNRRGQLERASVRLAEAKQISRDEADRESAFLALQNCNFDFANTQNAASWVSQQIEVLSAEQLADRQDRINASLRRAVEAFRKASLVASGDKADQALLKLAQIYDERLGDAEAAMQTWSDIATQYAGTSVAEDASWRLAEAYQRRGRHAEAIDAFSAFLRNYRRSPRADAAQMAIAEGLENLGRWIEAMDAYQRYLESFPEGGSAARAREQIGWIKTYRL